MEIHLNGTPRILDRPLSVAELLASLDLGRERVAVAVNREVVPRTRLAETVLRDGDTVEIIQAVAGG